MVYCVGHFVIFMRRFRHILNEESAFGSAAPLAPFPRAICDVGYEDRVTGSQGVNLAYSWHV